MQVYITAIEEGFLYGLLALGIYISLRILDIPDLTTEGSFGFGSAVAAIVASKGLSVTSFIAAFAAGVLAGIVTGLLQTKLKVLPVLAGIITMSGLYSINLMVIQLHYSNIHLFFQQTRHHILEFRRLLLYLNIHHFLCISIFHHQKSLKNKLLYKDIHFSLYSFDY